MVCSVYMGLTNGNIWSEISVRWEWFHYDCTLFWRLLSLVPFRVRLHSWMLLFSKQSSLRWAPLFLRSFACAFFPPFFASQKGETLPFKSLRTFPCLSLLSLPSPRTPPPSICQTDQSSFSYPVVRPAESHQPLWRGFVRLQVAKIRLRCSVTKNFHPRLIERGACVPWHFQLVA